MLIKIKVGLYYKYIFKLKRITKNVKVILNNYGKY